MTDLKRPPVVSRKVMIGMAAFLALLAILVLLLAGDEFLPPVIRDISHALQGIGPEEDPSDRAQFEEQRQATEKAIAENIKNPHYRKQLEGHVARADNEEHYLDLRNWSLWHLALPFTALMIGWVWWKRRKSVPPRI